ncbi:MAG: hypothetical protein WAM11_09005 [Cyanobium sp.]
MEKTILGASSTGISPGLITVETSCGLGFEVFLPFSPAPTTAEDFFISKMSILLEQKNGKSWRVRDVALLASV